MNLMEAITAPRRVLMRSAFRKREEFLEEISRCNNYVDVFPIPSLLWSKLGHWTGENPFPVRGRSLARRHLALGPCSRELASPGKLWRKFTPT